MLNISHNLNLNSSNTYTFSNVTLIKKLFLPYPLHDDLFNLYNKLSFYDHLDIYADGSLLHNEDTNEVLMGFG